MLASALPFGPGPGFTPRRRRFHIGLWSWKNMDAEELFERCGLRGPGGVGLLAAGGGLEMKAPSFSQCAEIRPHRCPPSAIELPSVPARSLSCLEIVKAPSCSQEMLASAFRRRPGSVSLPQTTAPYRFMAMDEYESGGALQQMRAARPGRGGVACGGSGVAWCLRNKSTVFFAGIACIGRALLARKPGRPGDVFLGSHHLFS